MVRNVKTYILTTLAILTMSMTALAATSPSPPTDVTCSLSGSSLTVNWNAPVSSPVPITNYRIHVYKDSNISITTYVYEPEHTITFTGQSTTSKYEVHIRSRTATGTLSSSIKAICSVASTPTPTPEVTPTPTPEITPTPTPIIDPIPTQTVTNLHNISYAEDYINWTWTDPTDVNYSNISIYIDGEFITNVGIGVGHYNATGDNFTPNTIHDIGTQTVDIYGNINPIWVNDTARTSSKKIGVLPVIRFITIGDTHITSNTSKDAYKNFTRAVNYINNMTDVDFVIELGDIVDGASSSNFDAAKSVISRLNKPYYVIKGNHDGVSSTTFEQYFGPSERIIKNMSDYQLIFVGIKPGVNGSNRWSFDYNISDKNKPTIIFNHGPVQPPKYGETCYDWINSGKSYAYSCDMKNETDKFTNLLGYYDGHVHKYTNQRINSTLYITEEGLGGISHSIYIGYTEINNRNVTYRRIKY